MNYKGINLEYDEIETPSIFHNENWFIEYEEKLKENKIFSSYQIRDKETHGDLFFLLFTFNAEDGAGEIADWHGIENIEDKVIDDLMTKVWEKEKLQLRAVD